MKKGYYILLATMLLSAGCTDKLTEQPISPEQIYFGVVIAGGIEVTTRSDQAVQSDTVALVSEENPDVILSLITSVEENLHSPFEQQANTRATLINSPAVALFDEFGWFALNSSSQYVYRNVGVTKSTTDGNVFYAMKPWPSTSETYSFYAYYPSLYLLPTAGLSIKTDGGKDIKEITYNMDGVGPEYQSDLMVAYASANYNSGTPVPLTFYHACTAVVIEAGDLNDANAKVKSVTFENINTSGDCEITNSSPFFSWSNTASSASYQVYADDTGTVQNTPILSGANTLMMIPQDFTSADQKIKVIIDDTTYTATLNTTSWEAGKVVTYTITRS